MVKATPGVAPPSAPALGKFPSGLQAVTHWAMAAAAAADWEKACGAEELRARGAEELRARGAATEAEFRSRKGPQALAAAFRR